MHPSYPQTPPLSTIVYRKNNGSSRRLPIPKTAYDPVDISRKILYPIIKQMEKPILNAHTINAPPP